ncbi:hypothetical protein HII31_09669 [Pseudocercospora fuligena]|uniref:Thioesterase-like superfamily-domain-containing protein n=1 Tax=Pseudocercospora fuligena TaxID=685502 RepID=A0A8H6VJH0_9PEZI|nr:hypothetical protein HII31_09669 [Pseudocercospora fuligena]
MAAALTPLDGIRGRDLLTFDEATPIERINSHEYQTKVDVEYNYGSSAHGGFLVALVWKTIKMHYQTTLKDRHQPDTTSFHLEFLRPTTTGPVSIHIKDVRLGKATSVVHATMIQGGTEKCVAYATNSGPKASQGTISNAMGGPKMWPPAHPISFSKVLSGTDPNWIRYDVPRLPDNPDHALSNIVYALQRPGSVDYSDPAWLNTVTLWISPRIPEEKWHTEQLGIVFDSSVPPLENWYGTQEGAQNYITMPSAVARNEKEGKSSYDHPPWDTRRFYPTVSMTIEVKRQLPAEGEKWLCLRQNTKECVEGRFDMDATVWDVEGKLIAVSQSFWYVVEPPREGKQKSASGRMAIIGKGMKKSEEKL